MSAPFLGPLLHFTFDSYIENSTTLVDISGNNNPSVTSHLGLTIDQSFGFGLTFDGYRSHVGLPSISSLNLEQTDFTVSCWINAGDLFGKKPIFLFTNQAGKWFSVYLQDGVPTLDIDGQTSPANFSLERDIWYHFAFQWDESANSLTFFLNGLSRDTVSGQALTRPTIGMIGGDDVMPPPTGSGSFYKGKMHEFRIFNYLQDPTLMMQNIESDRIRLSLFLPLKSKVAGLFPDVSQHQHTTGLVGTPELVSDNQFENAVEFDSATEAISIPAFSQLTLGALSLSFWIQSDGNPMGSPTTYQSPDNDDQKFPLNPTWMAAIIEQGFPGAWSDIANGEWRQVTLNMFPGQLELFIDGRPGPAHAGGNISLFESGQTTAPAYSGRMVNFRFFKVPQPVAQIEELIREDLSANIGFQLSHPLDFDLRDEQDNFTLYFAEDPAGQVQNLHLKNTSGHTLDFAPPADFNQDSPDYHIRLRLRPSTLSNSSLAALSPISSDWTLHTATESDGIQTIHLRHSAGFSMQPGRELVIPLQNMAAAPKGGARNTRIQFDYANLRYNGETVPVTGTRSMVISIQNKSGSKMAPIHFGFSGPNSIINVGGQTNAVGLLFSNIHPSVPLSLSSGELEPQTEFVISFEYSDGPGKDFALCTVSEANGISISSPDFSVRREGVGMDTRWVLSATSNNLIPAGESFGANISNIVSSLPSGLTNMYIQYINLPGYDDGQVVVQLEKTPLITRNRKVGLRTSNPQYDLSIGEYNTGLHLSAEHELSFYLDGDQKCKIHEGGLTLGTTQNQGVLSLGGVNEGYAGVTGSAQLYLGGTHNTGVNRGGIKLLIDGYDNDGNVVFPIKVRDENGNTDFQIQSANLSQGIPPRSFLRGNLGMDISNPEIRLAFLEVGTGIDSPGPGNLTFHSSGNEIARFNRHGLGIKTTNTQLHLAIGDDDTGLHQHGDGKLGIHTNGQERIRIQADGKVGIQTNAPDYQLSIGAPNTGINRNSNGDLEFYHNGNAKIKFAPITEGWGTVEGIRVHGKMETDVIKGNGQSVFDSVRLENDLKIGFDPRIGDSGGMTYGRGGISSYQPGIGPINRLNLVTSGKSWFHGGNVGIMTTNPLYNLDVNGNIRTQSFYNTSSAAKKQNISSIQRQAAQFKKLRPVSFEWKESGEKAIGLIAEEVAEIYPEFVSRDEEGRIDAINYTNLIGLLVSVVREQQDEIETISKNLEEVASGQQPWWRRIFKAKKSVTPKKPVIEPK